MTAQKQAYYQQDMSDWCEYSGVTLNFPDVFPIRTILPLRVTLASQCDPSLIRTLCEGHIISLHVHLYVHCSLTTCYVPFLCAACAIYVMSGVQL